MATIISGEGITFPDLTTMNSTSKFLGRGSSVYGLIHNLSDDTFKRFGTGTTEDDSWLSVIAPRMNDEGNNDLVTTHFNQSYTVQGNMKRVVVDNLGNYIKDYNATAYDHSDQTGLLADEMVGVQMPKFEYINVQFSSGGKLYNIYAQSLNAFSIDLTSFGFSPTEIKGVNVSEWTSYGNILGNVVTSTVHNAFKDQSNVVGDYLYFGAFKSYEYTSGKMKSTCTTTGTSTPVKATGNQLIANFRTKHQAFGNCYTQNWFQREALVLTAMIERGTTLTEVNGSNIFSKWEGYSWTSTSSDGMNLGLTLPLGNSTGVIRDASNRTIANNYRGIEGYHSHLWEFVDGINIIDGAVWVAKTGSYTSDVTTAPYFNSNQVVPTAGTQLYIKEMNEGSFLPKSTGATNLTKYTDGFWGDTGNRIVVSGGDQLHSGISGLFTWTSSSVSSHSNWTFSSRPILLK